MLEIEFSVMEGHAGDSEQLLPLLEAFEKQYHIHVNVVGIPWDRGWTEIAKFGIFEHGPDVSSIGTTWIGSLAAMQALRSFSPQEVRALGGAEAFFEPIWKAGFLPGDPTPWAIPWLGDAMVFYYWKEALEQAGLEDVPQALVSGAALRSTLEKLQKKGHAYPLNATTVDVSMILHEAAHWIWDAGGDFLSADARQVAFNQPAAMQGLHDYFSLRPLISHQTLGLNAATAGQLFLAGEAVLSTGGPWLGIAGRDQNPGWNETLGIQVPQSTYVGGASFVIWRYSRKSQEAFELIRFLSAQPSHIPNSPHSSELPTKRDALNMPSVERDVFHRAYIHAMQTGRVFPTLRLWGSMEEKLIAEIAHIWTDLFANPDQDLDACLHQHLDPLAKRLNIVLDN